MNILGLFLILSGIGLILYAISTGSFWRDEVNIRNLWAGISSISSLILLFIGFRCLGFYIWPSSFWAVLIFVVTILCVGIILEKDLIARVMGILVLISIIVTCMVIYWTAVKPSAPLVESIFKHGVEEE